MNLRNASQYNHLPRQHSPTKRPLVVEVEAANGTDDDEWLTSESGAVTPAEHGEEDAPPTPRKIAAKLPPVPVAPQAALPPQPDILSAATPRPDLPPSLPPADSRPAPRPKQRPQSLADLPRVQTTMAKFTTGGPSQPSRTPSPEPDHRRAVTRPPSARSIRSVRPHPLIRTRSYAPSTPTVSAAPPAFSPTTASPLSSPLAHQLSSPTSTHYSQFLPGRLRRKTSESSVTSIATLPLPTKPSTTTTASLASTTRVHGERQRTMSQGLTSAALSSLAAAAHPQHGLSRPTSPVLPITFPPPNLRPERAHSVMSAPLAIAHQSAIAHHRPMREALDRVARRRAKAGVNHDGFSL